VTCMRCSATTDTVTRVLELARGACASESASPAAIWLIREDAQRLDVMSASEREESDRKS